MKLRHLLCSIPIALAMVACKDDDARADSAAQTNSETRPAAEAKYHYAVAMTGVV